MKPLESQQTNDNNEEEEDSEIFKSEDEMKRSLTRLCYGDLCVIGKIWIRALKYVLVGARMSLVPVVKAAKPAECPKRPPPMKYKDLPIYKSPHYDYKDHIAQKERCPEANDKLIHNYLFPRVACYRRCIQEQFNETRCMLKNTCKDICSSINSSKKDFKRYMRCPENLQLRQAVLATSTATGFLLGSGRGIPRRLFFTGLGALAGGALCFPKETDEAFRSFLFNTGKGFINAYNLYCGKGFALRERIPCKDDMPPPPQPRKQQCPEKK
ncbi:uncharacterized protein LOC131852293 [Achroia grisella]|uniref:uncharacterized protein LOC131852293 n=1 Tax=Achroia grisella TaxID=688607 RepID=UPI0027D227FC|nr:uncharacterized protein LOC131852293 [Achroia grisella]